MTVLFGAHGLAATLTADAGRSLIERMGTRAQATGPASRPKLSSMIAADGVAFGVCELQYAGEPTQVRTAQAGPLLLVTQGRLDTRAELIELLGLPADPRADAAGGLDDTPSDTALILAAYQRFGIDCVEHLVGDWVFALWDAERKRLVLARDASGVSALFWWQGAGHLLFATSLPTLMAAGPMPTRPNPRWIANLLTLFDDPAQPGATAFDSVFSVPPGHFLIAQGGRAELRRWWRPEALPPPDETPLPELEARFLARYDAAVRQRLRRPGGSIAATLSGGLDSGSVVALAATALAEQGQRLTAYVHTPRFDASHEHPTRVTNEWALAQATARHAGSVDAIACPTENLSPLDGIERWLDIAMVPSAAAVNSYWMQDIAMQAAASGARVLLTGQGGNGTVSYAGTGNLWPRVRSLRLAHAMREVRAEESGWPSAVRDRLIKPALRPAWHRVKRAWSFPANDPAWSEFALLKRSLADELGLEAAMREARHDANVGSTAERVAKFRLGLLGGADNGNSTWAELGTTHGLDVRDPTRDQNLVELCWQLPDELFWAHGRRRGLIRSTMSHKLPHEVLTCAQKGLQSADVCQRLRACGPALLGQVADVSRHALVRQWIDTDRLALSANAALQESPTKLKGAVPVAFMLHALAVAVFITRHS